MSTTPVSYHYYPALSNLINAGDLPDFLNFIEEQIQSILDKIYYKNYCASENITGSSAFYRLEMIPRTRISQELFGSGLSLVLNPDYEDSTISSFPITVFWQWEILRYVRNFNINTFPYTPQAFFELAIEILGLSKEQILVVAENTLASPVEFPFKELVADINTFYHSHIEIDLFDETRYEQLIEQIEALNGNVFLTILELYLLSSNVSESKQNLKDFFHPFFSVDFENYIKELLIPKISASLHNISLAIEFPRTWLKPINETTGDVEVDENIKSMLRFHVGALRFSTENGFEFENESTLSFTKSEIGNTGLTFHFEEMKLDLSRTQNIPEAEAAGYPADFVGVFVKKASIGLPSKWFNQVDNTTLSVVGYDILAGSGGFSGRVALEASTPDTPIGADDYLWVNLGERLQGRLQLLRYHFQAERHRGIQHPSQVVGSAV